MIYLVLSNAVACSNMFVLQYATWAMYMRAPALFDGHSLWHCVRWEVSLGMMLHARTCSLGRLLHACTAGHMNATAFHMSVTVAEEFSACPPAELFISVHISV